MSIIPQFYPDNKVARKMISSPNTRDTIFNLLRPIYGTSYKLHSTQYLFVEFLGLHGKKSPLNLTAHLPSWPLKHIRTQTHAVKNIEDINHYIDDPINGIFHVLQKEFELQLLAKYDELVSVTKKSRKFSESIGSEIYSELFDPIIKEIDNDYPTFASNLAYRFAWQYCCSIKNINKPLLSQILLGIWNQVRENGLILPLAKAAAGLFNLESGVDFRDGLDDMMDSDGITLAILDGVTFVTYDLREKCDKRVNIINQTIDILENNLKIQIPRNAGRVVCLPETNFIEPETNLLDILLDTSAIIHLELILKFMTSPKVFANKQS